MPAHGAIGEPTEVAEAHYEAGESRGDIGLRELFAAMPERHRAVSARRVSRCGFMDKDFVASSDRPAVVAAALDAVLNTTGTDMGKVQLRDEASGQLRIESHRGLNSRFVDYLASVRDIESASGYPLARGHRIIVRDVAQSRIFPCDAREVVLTSGARSVQATPVIGSSGRLLGLLSTHHDTARRPENLELRLLDHVAQWIARLVEPSARVR
ncbi:MAG: GAF domain-containing protein [Acidimicrobiales bacterium]